MSMSVSSAAGSSYPFSDSHDPISPENQKSNNEDGSVSGSVGSSESRRFEEDMEFLKVAIEEAIEQEKQGANDEKYIAILAGALKDPAEQEKKPSNCTLV